MPETFSFLPDANQELLLKAALQDGDAAIESWNEWCRRIPLDDVDLGSQRLLPLLLHRLRNLGVDDPELRRYQSVARYVWLQNQRLVWRAQQILRLFAEAGIPALPLKGLAVGPLYYPDLRLRAMNDIDVLTPCASVGEAGRLLASKGWRSPNEARLQFERYLPTHHAACFTNAEGIEFDLHWHLCSECCSAEADEAFWRDLQPLSLNGIETKTLSDTGHLFHTCVHGGRPNELSPIRWIADSAQILRAGTIDWRRMLDLASEFRLVRRLQQTLGVLHGTYSLPIPDSVIAQLGAKKPSAIEALEERTALSRLPRPVKSSLWHYSNYRRNVARRAGDKGLVRYLQDSLGTPSLAATFLRVARSLW